MGKLQDLLNKNASTEAEPICSPTDTNDLAAEFAADWSESLPVPEALAEAAMQKHEEVEDESDNPFIAKPSGRAPVVPQAFSAPVEEPVQKQEEVEVYEMARPVFDEEVVEGVDDIATTVPTIASSAGLVHIEFTKWGGPVTDRAVTDEVLSDKNASEGAAVVKKRPIPNSPELRRIESLSNTLRNRGKKYCLPWIGNGWYLLPTANYAEFMREMAQANDEWDEAVDAFIKVYARQVTNAVNDLGGMYDSDLYPSESVLRAAFRMEVHEGEVQTTGKASYYDNLTEQQIADSQYRIDKQNERFVKSINPYIWGKMRKPLEDLLIVLDEAKYSSDDKPRYQQTKVTNVIDAALEATSLNVTNDPQVSAMSARILSVFVGITTDALKDDSYLRNEIRNAVTTILGGFPS